MSKLPVIDPALLEDISYKFPPLSVNRDSIAIKATVPNWSLFCKSYDHQRLGITKTPPAVKDVFLAEKGYDDQNDEEKNIMKQKENYYLERLKNLS